MAKQEERRAATRALIMDAAEKLFGAAGFDQTSIDDIALEAGVAKGAVYHHFKNKRDLFEAVFEIVSARLALALASEVSPGDDMVETLLTAMRSFFHLCATPETLRILLQDGPKVLGHAEWRRLDARHFGGLVTSALGLAMETGAIGRQPLEPLSHIMLAAIQAAAVDCAGQEDFDAAANRYLATFRSLLVGLGANRHPG